MEAADSSAVCLNPSSAVRGKCIDRNSSLTRSSFFIHQGIFFLGFSKIHTQVFPTIVREITGFDKAGWNRFNRMTFVIGLQKENTRQAQEPGLHSPPPPVSSTGQALTPPTRGGELIGEGFIIKE
jgi:hypothetical protein